MIKTITKKTEKKKIKKYIDGLTKKDSQKKGCRRVSRPHLVPRYGTFHSPTVDLIGVEYASPDFP
jgi:hypothetical protein